MKNNWMCVCATALVAAFSAAYAAINPYQSSDLHYVDGNTVRVFDILVEIEDGYRYFSDDYEIIRGMAPYYWENRCEWEWGTNASDPQWHMRDVCWQAYLERSFREFARRLYEATNGKHLLGKVNIVRSNSSGMQADITVAAEEKVRSHATVNGLSEVTSGGITLGHRVFWDEPIIFNPIKVGATITHEWGHYAYGLGDEYPENNCKVNSQEDVKPFLKKGKDLFCPSGWATDWERWDDLWQLSIDGAEQKRQSLRSERDPQLSDLISEHPSLMNAEGGPSRYNGNPPLYYANFSTVESLCKEGTSAPIVGKCTPKEFATEHFKASLRGTYPAWTVFTRPDWAVGLAGKPPFPYPELADVAPSYADVDEAGHHYVKSLNAPDSVSWRFLEFTWDVPRVGTAECRAVEFVVDLSTPVIEAQEEIKGFVADFVELAGRADTSLRMGLTTLGNGVPELTVSMCRADDAVDSIRAALSKLRFGGGGFIHEDRLYAALYDLDSTAGECAREVVYLTGRSPAEISTSGSSPGHRTLAGDAKGKNISVHTVFALQGTSGLSRNSERMAVLANKTGGTVSYLNGRARARADALVMLSRYALRRSGTRSMSGREAALPGGNLIYAGHAGIEQCHEQWTVLELTEGGTFSDCFFEAYHGWGARYSPEWDTVRQQAQWERVDSKSALARLGSEECISLADTSTIFYGRLYFGMRPQSPSEWYVYRGGGDSVYARFYAPPSGGMPGNGSSLNLHGEISSDAGNLSGASVRAEICDLGVESMPCDTVPLHEAPGGGYDLRWDGWKTPGPFSVYLLVDVDPDVELRWCLPEGGNCISADASALYGVTDVFEFEVAGRESEGTQNGGVAPLVVLDSGVAVAGRVSSADDINCFQFGFSRRDSMVVRLTGIGEETPFRLSFFGADGSFLSSRNRNILSEPFHMTASLDGIDADGVCVSIPGGQTGNYTIKAEKRQGWDVTNDVRLRVEAKDHHLGHPQISVLSFRVENVGQEALDGGALHYFFTMPEAMPHMLDHYTPESAPEIVSHGNGRYELKLTFEHSIAAGESWPSGLENQIHLRGQNYETLDKSDDWSNPESVLFTETDRVVVTDGNGQIVYGKAPEWWSMGGVQ